MTRRSLSVSQDTCAYTLLKHRSRADLYMWVWNTGRKRGIFFCMMEPIYAENENVVKHQLKAAHVACFTCVLLTPTCTCVALSAVSSSHSGLSVVLQPLCPQILPYHTKEDNIVMTWGHVTQKKSWITNKLESIDYTDTNPQDVQCSPHEEGHMCRLAHTHTYTHTGW